MAVLSPFGALPISVSQHVERYAMMMLPPHLVVEGYMRARYAHRLPFLAAFAALRLEMERFFAAALLRMRLRSAWVIGLSSRRGGL